MLKFYKTPSCTEKPAPLFSQGIVSVAGTHTRQTRTAMRMRTVLTSLSANATTTEAPSATNVRCGWDTEALAQCNPNADIIQLQGFLRGAP